MNDAPTRKEQHGAFYLAMALLAIMGIGVAWYVNTQNTPQQMQQRTAELARPPMHKPDKDGKPDKPQSASHGSASATDPASRD